MAVAYLLGKTENLLIKLKMHGEWYIQQEKCFNGMKHWSVKNPGYQTFITLHFKADVFFLLSFNAFQNNDDWMKLIGLY